MPTPAAKRTCLAGPAVSEEGVVAKDEFVDAAFREILPDDVVGGLGKFDAIAGASGSCGETWPLSPVGASALGAPDGGNPVANEEIVDVAGASGSC